MIDVNHIIIEAISVTLTSSVPIMIYIAANKRGAKEDAQRRDSVTQDKLDAIVNERAYLRPHDHIETEGALQMEGIIRKRNGNNGHT